MPPIRSPGPTPARSTTSRWTPPVVWTAIILTGTSWPSISVGPDTILGFDKVVHFSMYAVLSALVLRASASRPTFTAGTYILVVVGLSIFGAADEWHQGLIPGRSSSVYDWIADTLGILAGLFAVRYIPQLAPRRPATAK